ncbi:MAG TPA: FHA domain-containing protein [Blastocatellia bacterium]|nr:FHA domain-containing protein [Blastocatellia bacterium]
MRIVAKHLTGARTGEMDVFNSVPLTIGRLPASNLRLGINDTRASARHAEIIVEQRQVVLRDVGSTNGTFVNGKKLPSAVLNNGDIVEFGTGGPKLQFEIDNSLASLVNEITGTNGHGYPQEKRNVRPTSENDAKKIRVSTIPRQPEAVITPPEPQPELAVTLMGDREYIIKSKFKYYLVFPGIALFTCGLVMFIYQNPLAGLPLMLLGLLMGISGLAMGRKNITITRKGIKYEGLISSRMIPWDEIEHLTSQRSRTQVLTHQIYIVHGKRSRIVFSPTGYLNGMEMIQLIARQSGQKWQ